MSLYLDIRKCLGDFTLEVQLEAADETVGLLGASGSGKSLTLRCIAGVVTPDSGVIALNGRLLYSSQKKVNLPPRKRSVGLMFQNYALFPHMTVAQNIAAGVPDRAQRADRVADYLELLQLHGLENRYPAQLSGGQQQRVALARMMAGEPDILMLDEPFSALDRHLRFTIEREFSRALEQFCGTVLLVSHNVSEIYQYCARTAVLAQGRVAEQDATQRLFHSPRTVEGARLTGCKNLCPVCHRGGELYAPDWNLAFPPLQGIDPARIVAVAVREGGVQIDDTPWDGGFPVTLDRVRPFPRFSSLSLLPHGAALPLTVSVPDNLVELYQQRSADGQLFARIDPAALLPLCDIVPGR